jgi:hypothetical protein
MFFSGFCNSLLYKCLQLRPHPSALEIPDVELEVANRPKGIRIHLALSRVRVYLLRFNSSGNFCDAVLADDTDGSNVLRGENGAGVICSRRVLSR